MRIGINIRGLTGFTGVQIYLHNLIHNILEIDNTNQYILFYNLMRNKTFPDFLNKYKNVICCSSNIPGRIQGLLQFSLKFPVEFFYGSMDIFHEPWSVSPPTLKAKRVITVFDISDLLFPELYKGLLDKRWRKLVKESVKQADKIIVPSISTKNDLVNLLKISQEKIIIILLGIEDFFKPYKIEESLHVTKKYNLPERFILFLGAFVPRKNLTKLIEAFSIISDKEIKLVLVGSYLTDYKNILSKISELNLNNRVILIDGATISREELPFLYNLAELFVFPSLYEGFGLPILEAMACGIPVTCSNISSLPEIANNAALLFNPHNIEDIADKINRILSSREIRDSLIKKGIENSKKFSWKGTVEKHLEVYKNLL